MIDYREDANDIKASKVCGALLNLKVNDSTRDPSSIHKSQTETSARM